MLKAENISKSFIDRSSGKTFELLHDVSLEIKAGEAVALMGGSGSGKSTLARILLRLLPCDCGKIYFQGQDILCHNSGAGDGDIRYHRNHRSARIEEI